MAHGSTMRAVSGIDPIARQGVTPENAATARARGFPPPALDDVAAHPFGLEFSLRDVLLRIVFIAAVAVGLFGCVTFGDDGRAAAAVGEHCKVAARTGAAEFRCRWPVTFLGS